MKIRSGLRPSSKHLSDKKQPKPPRRSWRQLTLIGILLVLLMGFWYRGGISRIAAAQAESAIKRWRVESASKWLNFAQMLGDQPEVHFLLARVARIDNDPHQMRKHLLKAHELGFSSELLNREQDLLRLSLGEIDSILESKAQHWIHQHPPDEGLVVDAYANGLLAQSRFSEAVTVLEEYERAFPEDPMVNYRFGVMNEHLRSSAKAEEEYKLALQKDPGYLRAVWNLARLKSGKNAPQEAIDILKPHEVGKPALAVRTMIAHCYQQFGDLEKSRELLISVADKGFEAGIESYRVVDEPPERFLAASELGVLDAKLGNWDEAKKYLELALEVNPRDFVARNAYAQTLRRLGFQEQAEKELKQITEERKEYDKITVLRDQVSQDQSNVDARVQMGKILFKYESERFGLFWVRSALTYDPKCNEAHQFLGDYYTSQAEKTSDTAEKQGYENKAKFHFGQIQSETNVVAAP